MCELGAFGCNGTMHRGTVCAIQWHLASTVLMYVFTYILRLTSIAYSPSILITGDRLLQHAVRVHVDAKYQSNTRLNDSAISLLHYSLQYGLTAGNSVGRLANSCLKIENGMRPCTGTGRLTGSV